MADTTVAHDAQLQLVGAKSEDQIYWQCQKRGGSLLLKLCRPSDLGQADGQLSADVDRPRTENRNISGKADRFLPS